ncbi:MAG: hypothetical protein Q8L70_08575 [Methylotenera sp.]|nr:hypothetical protein [Methylotenera sp.]MDP1958905.1 hypothetical protein [Methylotenera sp.]MDP3942900.1 hypothetical protein [Methylotenera sp.]
MARKSKQARAESISGGYGAIPWSVLDSASFMGASDKAKALLYALMRQHSGNNNGHLHLAKKWLYAHGWTCDENNRKACNELIERGLIVQTKWGGLNMGANYYAVTWHNISNFVGLDISAKGYSRGAYSLCNLPPTPRRKPPLKNADAKQNLRHDYRASASPTTEPVRQLTSTTTELVKPLLDTFTGTTTENNVFIPLHTVNSVKRIVGIKGKSGIAKHSLNTSKEYRHE